MIEFTAWPEMLAWPYLILNGWLPYRDIAIAHSPVLLLVLSLFYKIFGVGIAQLKIFTWILIILNSCLTFYVGNKYWNKKVGYLSGVFYILLCLVFQGNGLWFDLALVPFSLLFYAKLRDKKYFHAGLFFALGVLTKQTFIWFLIPTLYLFLKEGASFKKYLKFVYGSLVVLSIFIALLFTFGIADDFYNWAIKFGIFYLPNASGQVLFPTIKSFIFAALPFAAVMLDLSLLPWVIAGLLGVYPRWELFHFQPALPFLAIAISNTIFSKNNVLFKILIAIFISIYILIGISRSIGNTTRFYEMDVQTVVSAVNKDSGNVKTIYVANYWDNIYALTGNVPATKPLIPYIPWYLNYEGNRELIIRGLKTNMPERIIIGKRDDNFTEFYEFVSRFYSCNLIVKKVELCEVNR